MTTKLVKQSKQTKQTNQTKRKLNVQAKTKAFIRTDIKQNTWGLASELGIDTTLSGIPCSGDDNVPVISCIGTSRDGKSTLLNIINELTRNKNKHNDTSCPFVSRGGNEMVTNGIDYFHIKNKCILMDCQGMALKDAKHDHFLALIVYLISNVIILNVRQQLDLQVLNNMLAVFSFLSEIPPEHQRPDKPILVIRIKDFQDIEEYEEDPNYLDKYVDKWLEKSGDQYDYIKDAFSAAFDIKIVVTNYPEFTDRRKRILDIHDANFESDNPTIIEACNQILEFAENKQPAMLMKDPEKLRKLISDLRSNNNIDYKKLDLYHNITSLELERYVNQSINIKPYNDDGLEFRMDGSKIAYELYNERKRQIDKLYNETHAKFKEAAPELRNKSFKKWFEDINKIVDDAKTENMDRALGRIEPYIIKYNNKFNIDHLQHFDKLVHNVHDIFVNARNELTPILDNIDENVRKEIELAIVIEEKRVISVQKDIIKKNNALLVAIDKSIIAYNPTNKVHEYIYKEIDSQIANENFNYPMNDTFKLALNKVENDMKIICDKYKKIYLMGKDGNITFVNDANYDISKHTPIVNETNYWLSKGAKLINHIIMTKIDGVDVYNKGSIERTIHCVANSPLPIIDIILFDDTLRMTHGTYIKLKDIIENIATTYDIFDVTEHTYADLDNYTYIEIKSNDIPIRLKQFVKNIFYGALLDYVCENHQNSKQKLIFHNNM